MGIHAREWVEIMTRRAVLPAVLLGMLTAAAPIRASGEQTARADAAYKASVLAHKRSTAQHIVESPSSLVYCAVGNDTRVHNLGYMAIDTTVTIIFESDFDPIAMLLGVQLGADAEATDPLDLDNTNTMTWTDDDSGGLLEPELTVVAPFNGSYLLFVTPYAASKTDAKSERTLLGGCYLYELSVEPAVATSSLLQ